MFIYWIIDDKHKHIGRIHTTFPICFRPQLISQEGRLKDPADPQLVKNLPFSVPVFLNHRAAKGSPGISHFSFLINFRE